MKNVEVLVDGVIIGVFIGWVLVMIVLVFGVLCGRKRVKICLLSSSVCVCFLEVVVLKLLFFEISLILCLFMLFVWFMVFK